MQFSILINTHNQSKYLSECIESCVDQSFKGSYEIIICDTSKNVNKSFIKKYKKKNLKYFHRKSFSKFPILDQLYKNYFIFKKSRGRFIALLDGDDFFCKNKLELIYKIINKNRHTIFHDLPIYYYEDLNTTKDSKINLYKNNFFYKRYINNWPIVYGTSCLFFSRQFMKNFFSKKIVFNFSNVAIDIKIALFAQKFYKYRIVNKKLTFKRFTGNSLDSKYNKIYTRRYWFRRYEQFQFQKYIGAKSKNINYLLTTLIYYLIKLYR